MKLSLDWLSELVDLTEKDPEKIAAAITAHTAEVDDVERQGALLDRCVVGKVLSIAKHPNADKLSVCDVQTDAGVKKIVCGGTNLRVGMRCAFAHIGARVRWHGTEMQTLERAKIRGEKSEGMICTAEELDLLHLFPESRERTLIDLDQRTTDSGQWTTKNEKRATELTSYPTSSRFAGLRGAGRANESIGQPLREYLNLTDTVFHIDNHAITHRADLFSHLGFARELVAIGIAKWKVKNEQRATNKRINEFKFPRPPIPFKLTIEERKLMPRYCACVIEIYALGETPDWMKARLEATGWRSVNLPVDITNYVMMEIGVPLHSFDAGDIRGNVQMRKSKKGEKIETLDGSQLTLPEGALILEDDEGIFDLLGIMGGMRSSTKASTKRIYLHSASIDPLSIRRAVIETGHRTDAATVYEKGVPPVTSELGFYRALELMLELIPGAKIASRLETYGDNGNPKPIELDLRQVSRVLGIEIPQKTIEKILTDLEFTVERLATSGKRQTKKLTANRSSLNAPRIQVKPPLHRLGDIRAEHDVIEEVGRIYGFNRIDAVMPDASTVPPARDPRVHMMRDALKEDGFIEVLPLSLVSAALLQRCNMDPAHAVEIENPLGEELALLQTSLLPGLLLHAEKNLPLVSEQLRTFQWGHVFQRTVDSGQWTERSELTLLISAKEKTSLKDDPLLQAKQSLTHALGQIGFTLDLMPVVQAPAHAHPGRYAMLSTLGASIGTLFELYPDIRQRFDIPGRAAVATIDLTTLLSLQGTVTKARSLPQFPDVTYDETVTLTHEEHVGETLKELAKKHDLLESADIIDLFDVGNCKYNLTARFVYRAADRTLTEEEAKKAHGEVMKVLVSR